MKVKGFGNCLFLNFRSDYVTFLRNARNGHFGKKVEEKQNNDSRTDENNEDCDRKTTEETEGRSELQLLCRYNSCKAVADNGEGWKTAFRIKKKSRLASLIQWIRESGRGSELKLLFFCIDF